MVDQPKLDGILSNLKGLADYLHDRLGDFDRFTEAVVAATR